MSRFRSNPQANKNPSFEQAKTSAKGYLNNPRKLSQLLQQAQQTADKQHQGPLRQVWTGLLSTFRLLSAYASGRYTNIPWDSLVLLVASVLYLVLPVDLVPDFIPALGYLDDAALLAWALAAVKTDLENFAAWESQNHQTMA